MRYALTRGAYSSDLRVAFFFDQLTAGSVTAVTTGSEGYITHWQWDYVDLRAEGERRFGLADSRRAAFDSVRRARRLAEARKAGAYRNAVTAAFDRAFGPAEPEESEAADRALARLLPEAGEAGRIAGAAWSRGESATAFGGGPRGFSAGQAEALADFLQARGLLRPGEPLTAAEAKIDSAFRAAFKSAALYA